MNVASNSRLLQHLVQLGVVGESEVRTASARQQEQGGDILELLLEEGLIAEVELAGALASFYRVPQVNLTRVRVTKQALRNATGEFCRSHQALPFGIDHDSGELMVAIANPAQVSAIDALRFRTGHNVRTYVAPRTQLREAIEYYYFTDHSDSRPLTNPRKSGLTARPKSAPGTGMLRRPVTSAGPTAASAELSSGLGPLESNPGDFARPGSREYYSRPGPGTEELGEATVSGDPSDELFGRQGSTHSSQRPLSTRRPSDSAVSGIGVLNPFAGSSVSELSGDVSGHIERLEATIRRLEGALKREMAVSQALAEVLIENGLISPEQLKSRLRED